MEQTFIDSVIEWNETAKVTYLVMVISEKPIAVRVANALRKLGHEVKIDFFYFNNWQLTIKRLPRTNGE